MDNVKPETLKALDAIREHAGDLEPGKYDKVFDGVLQDADIGPRAEGKVFGHDKFPDGAEIVTSTIVKTGFSESHGYYVETLNDSRYLIATVDYNANLPSSTASVEAAIKAKQRHIDINHEFFEPYQWSRQGKGAQPGHP